MLVKTSGIILHTTKYSDSASIITCFTSDFGRISFIAHGINKKKSKCRAALLQPLSLVEIDINHLPGKDIQKLQDIQMSYTAIGIPFNPIKNSLALFISELLFRTLRQTEADENLFAFLENSIQQLDHCENGIANFHLVFLIKLSRYLGFEPHIEDSAYKYFDLMNGVFLTQKPLHIHYLLNEQANILAELLDCDYNSMQNLRLSRVDRIKMIESMIEYYRLHIPDFQGLHSLSVLQSLFD